MGPVNAPVTDQTDRHDIRFPRWQVTLGPRARRRTGCPRTFNTPNTSTMRSLWPRKTASRKFIDLINRESTLAIGEDFGPCIPLHSLDIIDTIV